MAKKMKHDDAAMDRKLIRAEMAKKGLKNGGTVKSMKKSGRKK